MKLITILACNFKLISKEKMIRLAFISNTWKQLRQLDAIWLSYCFIPWRSENLIIPSMIEPNPSAVIEINKKSIINKPFGHVT